MSVFVVSSVARLSSFCTSAGPWSACSCWPILPILSPAWGAMQKTPSFGNSQCRSRHSNKNHRNSNVIFEDLQLIAAPKSGAESSKSAETIGDWCWAVRLSSCKLLLGQLKILILTAAQKQMESWLPVSKFTNRLRSGRADEPLA